MRGILILHICLFHICLLKGGGGGSRPSGLILNIYDKLMLPMTSVIQRLSLDAYKNSWIVFIRNPSLCFERAADPVLALALLTESKQIQKIRSKLVPERMNHAEVYCGCRPLSWCETSSGREKRGAGALSVTTTTLEQIGNNIIPKGRHFHWHLNL